MADAYTNFSATLQGVDPENIRLRRDEQYNARWIDLDRGVSIRIDLKYPDDLRRDRAWLLRLAEVATQLAEEIGQQQEGKDDADDDR